MESNLRHEIRVGIFTLIGVILFCLSIILLGGDKFIYAKRINLSVMVPQSQGLATGSVVTLSGVQVGNVETVRFVKGSREVEVLLSISADQQYRITEGSKALIKTQGALGDKYIFIEPGPVENKPLADGSILETDKSPDFLDLIAKKGAEMSEIVEVVKELNILLKSINYNGNSGKLVSSLVQTSQDMGLLMTETRETMKAMRSETLQPLASVMKKIDQGQGTLGALVNDPSLHTRITNFFGDTPRNRFLKPLIRDSIQTNEK